MNTLNTVIAELFEFKPIEATGLKKEDAYLSILHSIITDNGPPDSYQQAHRDYPTSKVDALTPGDKEPLTCLIALEDFTKFCFFRKSHAKEMKDLYLEEKPTELILMQGEFITFNAKLVHAGGAYVESNLRLHLYLVPTCGLGTFQDEDGSILTECRPTGEGKRNKSNKWISKYLNTKKVKKQKSEEQGKRLLQGKRRRKRLLQGKRRRGQQA